MLALRFLRFIPCIGVAIVALGGTSSVRAQGRDTTHIFPVSYPRTLTVEPGDVLHLRIWREPDLSGDFPVAADSQVVLPKLGRMRVANISPDSLQRQLINAYSVYLRNPAIDIAISRRVSVLGEVKLPGSYSVDPTRTVADLITLAGGFTQDANEKAIRISRRGTVVVTDFPRYATLAELQLNSGDQLTVDKRSWAARGRGVYAVATGVLGLLYLLDRIGLLKKL